MMTYQQAIQELKELNRTVKQTPERFVVFDSEGNEEAVLKKNTTYLEPWGAFYGANPIYGPIFAILYFLAQTPQEDRG